MRAAVGFWLLIMTAVAAGQATRPRFYPDDPLVREPATQDAAGPAERDVDLAWDLLYNLFIRPAPSTAVRAMDVNTIDEVPDSDWYTNRVGPRRLTAAELAAGPDRTAGPQPPWTIVSGKTDGVMPGFVMTDAAGIRWFVKFDPPAYPELATGAEVVATRLFWALGYNVPENHIAILEPSALRISPSATMRDKDGRKHRLMPRDVDRLLASAARRPDGGYRLLASRALDGKPIGPFLYFGTRDDDPNDVVPHEHRRALRALRVFAAWLNHVDAKSINTLDTLVPGEGRKVVRHHLLDFGSTLGSAGVTPRAFDEGHEYLFDRRGVAKSVLTLGLKVPSWRRTSYDEVPPSIGRIEARDFDPATWKPRIPNPAFREALPDDLAWAARKLLFIDREVIEAAVRAADYADPDAAAYLAATLLKRRERVLQAYLPAAAPIVDARLSADGRLSFANAAVDAGVIEPPARYSSSWFLYDNDADRSDRLGERYEAAPSIAAPVPLPEKSGSYVRIDLEITGTSAVGQAAACRLFFRRDQAGWTLAGLDRTAHPLSGSRP